MKLYRVLPLLLCVLLFAGCVKNPDAGSEKLKTPALSIEAQPKFGGAYLKMTIEDFLALGFEFGDSVDIEFSNGGKMEDIPFYNGYYNRNGESLLVGYPGYPYVTATINNGTPGAYEKYRLDESMTGVISLHEKAKYLTVQNSLSMVYKNERSAYASDAVFANFREMKGGQMKAHFLYRSASPCDNSYNRAPYVNALYEEAEIRYVIDLADEEADFADYLNKDGDSISYWHSLQADGKILPLNLASNYLAEAYAKGVAEAARKITTENGPFVIHCTEGKDRTGFVCALFEALAGATIDEITADYMKTYENYYGLSKESNAASYEAVVSVRFLPIVSAILDLNAAPLTEASALDTIPQDALEKGAEAYLRFGGMTDAEILAVKSALRK